MIYSASWKSVTESVTKTVRYAGALRCVTVRYGGALRCVVLVGYGLKFFNIILDVVPC